MDIYQFMSDSPFLTFFLLWVILSSLTSSIKRVLRHMDIKKNGWPPAHCDSDGDFKSQ